LQNENSCEIPQLTIVYEPELPNKSGQTHGNIATAKGKQWRTGKQTFTAIF
jgi:hypothetical protein